MLNVGAALSYDISTLSRKGCANGGTVPETGTAPYIEARSTDRDGETYLKLRVVDVDGDLETLLYAEGELTEEQFVQEGAGTTFTVSDADMATFKIDHAGVYSFYARDKKGNQTVKTVRFALMSEGPGVFD